MQRLDGKTIAVTGAAGGLGGPLVTFLHEMGASVWGIDRVDCRGCDRSIIADLSDDASLGSLSQKLAEDTPDILVNLAGVMRFGLHERQTAEFIGLCYRVNLEVPAVLAAAVAKPMRERRSGQIVNVGSVLGSIPYPWFAAYSSSKAGLAALSQGLRRELEGTGVAVTHINPRAAKTPFNNADVNRFLDITGMKADPPVGVARTIAQAIAARRHTVNIGAMERIYAALNAIAPRLIDGGLAGQVRKARLEFS